MKNNLQAFQAFQVFMNYPYDEDFEPLSNAIHFAVIAAGLIPVCAKDLSMPDKSRLDNLIEAITNCNYSIHDFSKSKGEGSDNFARFNMPLEMGMAVFHALYTQRIKHRCAFFVSTPHDYQKFASDLSGLDPICHNNNEITLLTETYEWLRKINPPLFSNLAITVVRDKYLSFKEELNNIVGSSSINTPTHDEIQELMYCICSKEKWWGWRDSPVGLLEFPVLPLTYKTK
ncbi:MAG TPA: hypothetical protein PKE39_10380 [Ignavibacteria bacterium]|nr:hypothetical protein [Ignavibacteria bacterium]